MAVGDLSPISGLSGLTRSDHCRVSVFLSQPNCITWDFHTGVLVLQQMYFCYFTFVTANVLLFCGDRRMRSITKRFFGQSVIVRNVAVRPELP